MDISNMTNEEVYLFSTRSDFHIQFEQMNFQDKLQFIQKLQQPQSKSKVSQLQHPTKSIFKPSPIQRLSQPAPTTPSSTQTPPQNVPQLKLNESTTPKREILKPIPTAQQSDLFNKRLDICKACEFWNGNGCKICGCGTGKLQNPRSRCPANPPKWNAV